MCQSITTATNDGPKADGNPPDPIESKDIEETLVKEKEQLASQIEKLKEDLKEAKVILGLSLYVSSKYN